MKTTALIKENLIAPCGMNCVLCLAFLRDKKPCPGCRGHGQDKPKHCLNCSIKTCGQLEKIRSKFCFKCPVYPCARLRRLDKRYTGEYGMSMLDNLRAIKDLGIREFTRRERKRWACPECGGILCVHRETCQFCGQERPAPPDSL